MNSSRDTVGPLATVFYCLALANVVIHLLTGETGLCHFFLVVYLGFSVLFEINWRYLEKRQRYWVETSRRFANIASTTPYNQGGYVVRFSALLQLPGVIVVGLFDYVLAPVILQPALIMLWLRCLVKWSLYRGHKERSLRELYYDELLKKLRFLGDQLDPSINCNSFGYNSPEVAEIRKRVEELKAMRERVAIRLSQTEEHRQATAQRRSDRLAIRTASKAAALSRQVAHSLDRTASAPADAPSEKAEAPEEATTPLY